MRVGIWAMDTTLIMTDFLCLVFMADTHFLMAER